MPDVPASTKTKALLEGNDVFLDEGTYSGLLEKAGDHDWIRVKLEAGQTYNFYLCLLNTGSLTEGDSLLRLRAPGGGLLVTDNDGGTGQNSFLSFMATANGVYFIDVGAFGNASKGEYSLYMDRLSSTNVELGDGGDDYLADTGERVLCGKGNDDVTVGAGDFGVTLLGEQGDDLLTGSTNLDYISGGIGNDTINGGGGSDHLFGDAGNDIITGSDNFDDIRGGTGIDTINGQGGSDLIFGGRGQDFLTGGAGFDSFYLKSVADSVRGAGRDIITDFNPADDFINLSLMDARAGVAGNQTFVFIGSVKFHDKKGELRAVIDVINDRTIVQGDVNGDGKADFEIELTGQITLQGDDFFL